MTILWEPFRDIIDRHRRFVLSSHVRPDADALGSELALAGILEELGKKVRIVNPSAIPANLAFLDPENRIRKLGEGVTAEEIADTDVHIVLDTSAWAQLLDVGRVFRNTEAIRVVIDHHVSSDTLDAIEFKDTSAEATGALIFQMAETLGLAIPQDVVTPLFCAIATDTGWFRFPSTTSETMRTIARLIDLGAQPHVVYEWLYERNSLARLKLAARVLSRVTLDCDDKLAYMWVKQSDFADTGASQSDTEDLVNEGLTIAGTRCAFIAVEQQNATVKVSIRSRPGFDVARLAEQFGGGGHKQAAGAVLKGSLDEIKVRVLSAIRDALVRPRDGD